MYFEITTYYSNKLVKVRATRTKLGHLFVSQRTVDRAFNKAGAPTGDAPKIPQSWYSVEGGWVIYCKPEENK